MTLSLTLAEARRLGLLPKEPKASREPMANQPTSATESHSKPRKSPDGTTSHPKLSGEAVEGVVGGIRHQWRRCGKGDGVWGWLTLCERMTRWNEPVDSNGVDCELCEAQGRIGKGGCERE